MLYRLDTPSGPVCDLLGPRLLRTYSHARVLATDHAAEHSQPVTVTQITNAGRLNVKATVTPEGRWHK